MNETHVTRRKKRSPSVEARMVGSKPSPTFLDDSREWRRIFAEWWGTFLLVLAGAGSHFAGAVAGASDVSIAAAIAPALTVMSVIYIMGTVSGGHLNPAL